MRPKDDAMTREECDEALARYSPDDVSEAIRYAETHEAKAARRQAAEMLRASRSMLRTP